MVAEGGMPPKKRKASIGQVGEVPKEELTPKRRKKLAQYDPVSHQFKY